MNKVRDAGSTTVGAIQMAIAGVLALVLPALGFEPDQLQAIQANVATTVIGLAGIVNIVWTGDRSKADVDEAFEAGRRARAADRR